ncbi:hypothetical protein CC85DRAFT_288624 [Cutaneotrichosporon oleaginosum]|uniref:Uncharacterized protein n=1 Tax=Cutaneotrichosporon oleaginosum TaxID=879819 RepID=A0A0J1AVQ8_9TREE|nr:uncharacterized protein CC85DRAFT_288624 [Cutaneotrichosporon oleaginosum]KLT39369.1 hypothetical protein CC85DRAFT_288624 [Cutaneotrichosporon oleaginosum]TXT12085.1 hypothetical protein COLE_02495 [Cutaneotrichosporon oleaginosum]
MEFTASPLPPAPHAVPCLAQITLGSDGPRHSALMALTVDATATDRADIGVVARKVYWRARVGVDLPSRSLIITPSRSIEPLLDGPPAREHPEHSSGKTHLFHNHNHVKPQPEPEPVTTFPGVVDGRPLAAIRVPLSALDSTHCVVNTEPPAYILIPVATDDPHDAATLRFEFDSWLCGKADVEILAGQIHQALEDHGKPIPAPAATEHRTQEGVREGRDNDGSTHPSGDAPYDPEWKKSW